MSLDIMKQALAALEAALSDDQPYIERCKQTITALRAAIEQAQEPVAHTLNCVCGAVWDVSPDGVEEMVHAPTPPPRQWQGLTNDEIDTLYEAHHNQYGECKVVGYGYERAIEAKLREKNT